MLDFYKGKKVLVIDLDPQGNTTSGLGVDKNRVDNTVYELLLGEEKINNCINNRIQTFAKLLIISLFW